jgi:oligopeptidase A
MFDRIKANIKPVADESLNKLQKYSANHGNLTPLEYYDLEYWKTKQTNELFPMDWSKVSEYFPYSRVLAGIFELCSLLFNIEFKQDTSRETCSKLWHPDVVVYKVYDENSKHISNLVVDAFIRDKKIDSIWSYSGRESSEIAQAKPLSYLNLNVRKGQKSELLTFEQVKKLLYEFGAISQNLLTQTPYTDTSDRNSLEIDAANLNSQLFEKLIFVPGVTSFLTAHCHTGEPLPAELLARLAGHDSNLSSFSLMKKTMLAAFDLEAHISREYWADVYTHQWPKFMSTRNASSDFRPCQFLSIFGHSFGCTYYSLIWSEMLTADLLDAFKTVGFSNKVGIKDLGIRYRDSFLKNGSLISSNEKFSMFRGRNASMDPFIKSYLAK